MRYLIIILLFVTVACNKDETPQYNPIYSKIEGTWYTPPKYSRIRKWTFSKPKDSLHTQAYYLDGDTVQPSESFKYYIDNQNILYIRQSNNQAWTSKSEIRFINDSLIIGNYIFHK